MELVNHEPLDARVSVADVDGMPHRLGLLSAKVTYRFTPDGRVAIDTQDPLPLFAQDVATPLGAMPCDEVPRRGRAFEVIVLGRAHTDDGRPRGHVDVALTVGDTRRALRVTGDRTWRGDAHTPPVPFSEMPLTWDRAFGGTTEVELDAHTVVDVVDPWNRHGRGADLRPLALGLAHALGTPDGYPRVRGERWLPNLERADARVSSPSDAPEPACWATVPDDIGFRGVRAHRRAIAGASEAPVDEALLRAHPDWVLDAAPPAGARVVLENLVRGAPWVSFELPTTEVWADYAVDGRTGRRPLTPQMLVLLPDEGRLYIVHRLAFTVEHPGEHERSMRIRLAPRGAGSFMTEVV